MSRAGKSSFLFKKALICILNFLKPGHGKASHFEKSLSGSKCWADSLYLKLALSLVTFIGVIGYPSRSEIAVAPSASYSAMSSIGPHLS